MSEIVQLQIGQAGNRIGTAFTRLIREEHGVDSSGHLVDSSPERTYGLHRFFQETSEYLYQPRSLLIDLEPSSLDCIRGSTEGRLYSPDQYLFDQVGSRNLFPIGHYGAGSELAEVAMESVRKQVETCDRLQAFQVIHSVSGGTGSGLTTSLIARLKDEYCDDINLSYLLLPSFSPSDVLLSPYNALLSLHHLTDTQNLAILLHNSAISHCFSSFNPSIPLTFKEINLKIAQSMSDLTAPARFHSDPTFNYRKLGVNLAPYPRYHYLNFCVSAPKNTVSEAVTSAFGNSFSFLPAKEYVILTIAGIFRGKVGYYEANQAVVEGMVQRNQYMCQFWFKDFNCTYISPVSSQNSPLSACFLVNSPIITSFLSDLRAKFQRLYQKKAFLHSYLEEGMDAGEFLEADSNVNDVYLEYGSGKQNCICGYCDATGRAVGLDEDE